MVGDLKKLVAAQTGTRPESIRLQKWNQVFKVCASKLARQITCAPRPSLTLAHPRPPSLTLAHPRSPSLTLAHPRSLVGQDHITLGDYEIHDGMSLELYYN